MSTPFLSGIEGRVRFGGADSTDPLAFRVYDPDHLVLGMRMEEHLWPGTATMRRRGGKCDPSD